MDDKSIFIENLLRASGGSGLSKEELTIVFNSIKNIRSFAYMLSKAYELNQDKWLTCTEIFDEEHDEVWSVWHHIDEKYSTDWGFPKKQTGCYIYGYFTEKPEGIADPLSENVFYIGQSRSITRDGMINRKADFKGSVKNDIITQHGGGFLFKQKYGKENIDKVYQAYLPLQPYKCRDKETELLVNFFKKYEKLPDCNHETDYSRIKKLSEQNTLDIFYNE